jgi:thioredoxin 2
MTDVMTIRCGSCGATNRVPRDKLAQGLLAKCGSCKQPLPAPGAAPLIVTDATFAAEVEGSPLPVLVDAWAAWCGPCRMIAPAIDELAAELAGSVRVAKLNVDENPATAGRFDIRSIPDLARDRRRPRGRPHRRRAAEAGDSRAARALRRRKVNPRTKIQRKS